MNILYITMQPTLDVSAKNVHTDFLRKFRDEGHKVYLISPRERRMGLPTEIKEDHGILNLGVESLNVQKTNAIEKGLGQIAIDFIFKRAIIKYFSDVKFDIIIYATPPITLVRTIKYVKRKNPNAITYLTLKDIFPQNAVDLGMLSKNGLRGFLYRSFRRKEKKLYRISDWIGCMSPANVQYLLEHNPEINRDIVEICPNTFEVPTESRLSKNKAVLEKYGLPSDKPIFFYGGNLGKPQGIPFLIKCLDANKDRTDCHFLIIGNGFEFPRIGEWYKKNCPKNVTLLERLPRNEYDSLAESCDVGLIFLDYRFTIPNYPSRLLNCLMQKKPIIACTDPNCDTGAIAEENGYGFWCPSNSVEAFTKAVDKMLSSDIKQMGENGYEFFLENYTVQTTYDTIMKHIVSL